MMVAAKRGLIVEVTDGERAGYRGQILYDFVKSAAIRLAYAMAWDLAPFGMTALAVSPGFLRSEAMLERFGVTEANWRDALKADPAFAYSETPRFVGRAIAALAADPKVRRKSGMAFCAGDLAEEYGFDDVDGSRPHFWRSVEAWLDREVAKDGELTPEVRRMASARYMSSHLTPAAAEQMRAYAAKLGFGGLGGGLKPVGD